MKIAVDPPPPVKRAKPLHDLPPHYKARWILKRDMTRRERDGQVRRTPEGALQDIPANALRAVILKDDRGRYHIDNAGKFFLYHIVK